jgi:hypothetical protein
MNNLMLTFSGVELSRLRNLVAAVGKQIALAPGAATTAESQTPMTALAMTWSRLVEMLDLGTGPKLRACPECRHLYTLGATRCGHCWASLPTPQTREKLAA